MKVRDLVPAQEVYTVRPGQKLIEVAEVMKRHHVSGIPVVDDRGVMQGIVTIGQILHMAQDCFDDPTPICPDWHATFSRPAKKDWEQLPVEEAMIPDVVTVAADDDCRDAARAMLNASVHRAVVVDGGRRPVSMLTTLDFTRLYAASEEVASGQGE